MDISRSHDSHCYKTQIDKYDDKISEITTKRDNHNNITVQKQYDQNIKALRVMKDFDLAEIRPAGELDFLQAPKKKGIILHKGIQLNAQPNIVFEHSKVDNQEVGTVWLKAKVEGVSLQELGMLAEISYLYLTQTYGSSRHVDPDHVYAVDTLTGSWVSFSMVQQGKIVSALNDTVDAIIETQRQIAEDR